jgi:hypothetical protein
VTALTRPPRPAASTKEMATDTRDASPVLSISNHGALPSLSATRLIVSPLLSGHAGARDPVELVVDDRNQAREGRFVAVAPGEEERRDVMR